MTQEELEILNKARGWLENFAGTTRSSLLDGELSKIAHSLENIINKYSGELTLEDVEAVINSPNKNKPKIEPKLLPNRE